MTSEASGDHLLDLDAAALMSRGELESRAKALRTILAITDMLLTARDPGEVYDPESTTDVAL